MAERKQTEHTKGMTKPLWQNRSGNKRSRAVAPPADSLISSTFVGADLVDAFAIPVTPQDAAKGIDTLARCVMGDPSLWFRALLGTRDLLVAGLGIKTSRQIRLSAAGTDAEHIDFFRILSRSHDELILGEDDRHLDFRLSILLHQTTQDAKAELVATTVVQCHNRLGRAYLAAIAPFHRLIVPDNLNRASNKGWNLPPSQNGATF
jgi:hypothetical protein